MTTLIYDFTNKELIDSEGNKAIHYVRTDCLTELKPLLK